MSIKPLLKRRGAPVLIHREADTIPCPCRTPEGYRDPVWHKANPTYPECNNAGFIIQPNEITVKAFVMSAVSGGRRSQSAITNLFGEVQLDDHIGIFPMDDGINPLFFDNWTNSGENYIEYNGMRFIVVAWAIVPDPHNTAINHHWELGLRRINKDKFGPSTGF